MNEFVWRIGRESFIGRESRVDRRRQTAMKMQKAGKASAELARIRRASVSDPIVENAVFVESNL
jgi:hypothetical protein